MNRFKKFYRILDSLLKTPRMIFRAAKALEYQLESVPKIEEKIEDLRSIVCHYYNQTVVRETSGTIKIKYEWPLEGYFSQGNEDSILLEIVTKLGITEGTFLEIGVGDGRENNTLILRALGFRGVWVDINKPKFEIKEMNQEMKYLQTRVSVENCGHVLEKSIEFLDSQPDVFSLDIDGNDYHILFALMNLGMKPKVIVCEYNPKFPPPIPFVFPYNVNHLWNGGDYYGASLFSINELLSSFDYKLIACSLNGTNAFFLDKSFINDFSNKTIGLSNFMRAQYIFPERNGHRTTFETVNQILSARR